MGKSKKQKQKVDSQAWVKDMIAEFFKPAVDESEVIAQETVGLETAPPPVVPLDESWNRCEQGTCKRKLTHGCLHK